MRKLNWRSFTSMYIIVSFIVIIISGIILYIAPPGRITKWTYIPILGFEKDQWQSIHIIFTFLFVIASGFHLYFNWSIFMGYLKNKLSKKFTLKKETSLSFILTLLIFLFVLANIPPFSSVIEFGESYKESWENKAAQPPIPHAEELTLAEFAKLLKKPVSALTSALNAHNITATDTNRVIKDLANENSKSPSDIYRILQADPQKEKSPGKKSEGRGYGKKTIRQICAEVKIDPAIAIKKLALKGIEAKSESKIRDVALRYKMRPIEIINMIADKE